MERTDHTENTHILQTQLEQYVQKGLYPFHMPGHKRCVDPAPGLPASWDLTEVDGTDDLHDASGILRAAMQRTASLWGAERTWYLVNGSTCGLLAGIRALAPRGSEILCARNCHKAVFHAIELAGYRVHWILPALEEDWDICAGIQGDQVRAALRRYPFVKAVILTSPTYEGILSEVEAICRIAHARDIPVLVDEAHGAHLLPMAEEAGFPAGALAAGADLVVQSPHKTLPSLTQTALLHLQGCLVDVERIEAELDIFETSSPSYPLMASLDGCTGILRTQGQEMLEKWMECLCRFGTAVRSLRRLRILHYGHDTGQMRFDFDPGKILIDTRDAGMTGAGLASLLRTRYGMETEYARGMHVLVMTSPCDREDALDRLAAALVEIDAASAGREGAGKADTDVRDRTGNDAGRDPSAPPHRGETGTLTEQDHSAWEGSGRDLAAALAEVRPVSAYTAAEAAGMKSEPVPLEESCGRICAEYLYFYPPGIPFLAPGEILTEKHVHVLRGAAGRDAEDQDSCAIVYCHADLHTIRCLCE